VQENKVIFYLCINRKSFLHQKKSFFALNVGIGNDYFSLCACKLVTLYSCVEAVSFAAAVSEATGGGPEHQKESL
jgi:hypothetical protein